MRRRAYSRAGLLGNPSDGYGGKTLSFLIRNYFAEVKLSRSTELEFETNSADPSKSLKFDCLEQFVNRTKEVGIKGEAILLQSALFQFANFFLREAGLSNLPFKISFQSNIPREVGMAGSSAIVIAAIRGFCDWHRIAIAPDLLASLALAAEQEIGINAGLQDRVVQSYEGAVFMDFSESVMRCENGLKFGKYKSVNPTLFENLYVAFSETAAESTNVLHNDLRNKYESGDTNVIDTMRKIADLAESGNACLANGDQEGLSQMINRNFDLRRSICKLNPNHVQMVESARRAGASAKYCGSGGAIVGTYRNIETWNRLNTKLSEIGCTVFKPVIS